MKSLFKMGLIMFYFYLCDRSVSQSVILRTLSIVYLNWALVLQMLSLRRGANSKRGVYLKLGANLSIYGMCYFKCFFFNFQDKPVFQRTERVQPSCFYVSPDCVLSPWCMDLGTSSTGLSSWAGLFESWLTLTQE